MREIYGGSVVECLDLGNELMGGCESVVTTREVRNACYEGSAH